MTRSERAFEWVHGRGRKDDSDVLAWLNGSVETTDAPTGECARCRVRGSATEPIEREEAFAEAITYRRKDVRCLTVKQEDDLVAAMVELAANGTWGRFVDRHGRQGAGIHGTLGPGAGTGTGHAHRSGSGGAGRTVAPGAPDAVENAYNRFLPWHRLFLLEFEDELRALRKDITLPYWCWSEHQSLPGVVSRMPKTIKATATGDLAVLARATGTGTSALPSTGDVTKILEKTTFRAFTEALEKAHNLVHAWIGGTMNLVPISPGDPVFWLMHCEVDRIWTRWTNSKIGEQARLRRENRPVIAAGSNEMPGIDMARRFNEVPSLIATTRAFNLGYGYDRLEDAIKSTCTRP